MQLLCEVGLVGAHVAEHVEALHDLEVAERDRGGERMAAERDAVQVVLAALDERLRDAVGDQHRAERLRSRSSGPWRSVIRSGS